MLLGHRIFTTKKSWYFMSHVHLPVTNGNDPQTRDRLRCSATGDMERECRWSSCHLEVTLSLQQSSLGSSSPSKLPAHLLGADKYSYFFQKSHFSTYIHLPLDVVLESPLDTTSHRTKPGTNFV